MVRKLVIVGEYNPAWETHRFTNAALEHAQQALTLSLDVAWCSTQAITPRVLTEASGFWLATGTPYKNMHQALAVIRHARKHNIPVWEPVKAFNTSCWTMHRASSVSKTPVTQNMIRLSRNPLLPRLGKSLE